jgi:hypothetical protein
MSGVWFWLPVAGPIRISTVLGAVIVVLAMGLLRREWLGGIVVVIAWTSVFETIYHVVGIVGYGWKPAGFAWETAAVAGWAILAWVLGYRPEWRLVGVFALAMAVWIAFGFHYNVAGQTTPINVRDEVLNEVAKSSLGLAFLVGSLHRDHEELVEPLVDRDGGTGIGGRLHLHRVRAWLKRSSGDRVVPDESVVG